MALKKYAIVVAGGKGLRMGADIPKQFLLLCGRPVLMHSIEAFVAEDTSVQIILVLPRLHIEYWERLCKQYDFNVPHTIAEGGTERFYSGKNGLSLIADREALVAIHDGVRPLVSIKTIYRCFQQAESEGSAIPCINVPDSVRTVSELQSTPIDRNSIRLIQTPQTFKLSLLKDAYEIPFTDSITDDASVVELSGKKVFLVEGNRENIKITSPEDLFIANAIMSFINKDLNINIP